jgi:uncharacterized repeat protein (TIGR03803 family)
MNCNSNPCRGPNITSQNSFSWLPVRNTCVFPTILAQNHSPLAERLGETRRVAPPCRPRRTPSLRSLSFTATRQFMDRLGPTPGRRDLGSVYKISASGGYSILHGFSPVGFEDGAYPYAGVVLDASGNIYGTTSAGGFAGYGVVYTLSPSGAETILHVFSGGADGATPYSGVSLDSAGNLYGTTYAGGNGFGVVYKLTPAGEETILYRFTGSADGAYPNAGVILDSTGNLYGTTTQGGSGYGVVYELSPLGEESVIYTFNGTESGSDPQGGVVLDSKGNLFGTASTGGSGGGGVVFKLRKAAQ